MTIIDLLRARLASPSDETITQLCIELDDAKELLRTLSKLPEYARRIALTPSTLKNEEVKTCPYCNGRGGTGHDLEDAIPCPQCEGTGKL